MSDLDKIQDQLDAMTTIAEQRRESENTRDSLVNALLALLLLAVLVGLVPFGIIVWKAALR